MVFISNGILHWKFLTVVAVALENSKFPKSKVDRLRKASFSNQRAVVKLKGFLCGEVLGICEDDPI